MSTVFVILYIHVYYACSVRCVWLVYVAVVVVLCVLNRKASVGVLKLCFVVVT